MKSTKKSLLTSALSLAVSAALLVGTTFAWFTDSVTNKGNTIQAGTLDIGVVGYRLENGNWSAPIWENQLTSKALFNETTWEPGQYGAILLRVSNFDSTLAAKVDIDFTADGTLTDSLWYKLHAVQTTDASHQDDMLNQLEFKDHRPASAADGVKNMSEIENDPTEEMTLYTDYHKGQYAYYVLEYGMYTSADNTYQDATFNLDFTVKATQAPVEEDGFGSNQYDKDAEYPESYDVYVENTTDLKNAIDTAEAGDVIALAPDMNVTENITVDKPITITGNGAVFENKISVTSNGVTLKNIKMNISMTTNEQAAPISTQNNDLVLANCEITRTTKTAQPYGMLVDVGTGKLSAKNTVFTAPFDPDTAFNASPSVIHAGEVDLDGCVIATDGYGLFAQHVTKGNIKNTKFTGVDGRPTLGCFNSTMLDGLVFDGCTFEMGKNSIVTAGNFTVKNSTFDFTNTPDNGAGNGINVYAQNGDVVLSNNIFKLSEGKTGINLTSADWASGTYDASKVTISGNTFEGTKATAIKISNKWTNELTPEQYESNNTLNGNSIVIQ